MRGASAIRFDHQARLREIREEIESQDPLADGWAEVANDFNEAMAAYEHQIQPESK